MPQIRPQRCDLSLILSIWVPTFLFANVKKQREGLFLCLLLFLLFFLVLLLLLLVLVLLFFFSEGERERGVD